MARRAGLQAMKTFVGIAVLLVIASVAGVTGFSALASIFNPSHATRLQKWTSSKTAEKTSIAAAGISVEFPNATVASSVETVNLFSGSIRADRRIVVLGDDAVELVWFRLPSGLNGADDVLRSLGTLTAQGLGGPPVDTQSFATSSPPAFEYRVAAPASVPGQKSQKGDYYVRIMIDYSTVYLLRVRASIGGSAALHHFANSYARL